MKTNPAITPGSARDIVGLIVLIAVCLGVSAAGGAVTANSVGTWYQTLQKPPFNPPDWVFAPVWTTLYVLMAIAAWRVWRLHGLTAARQALLLFFGLRLIGPALVEIGLLLIAIVATAIAFWRLDRLAGWLLAPYAAWVAFATLLNAALWRLNPAG